jgi:hypothetical protein
MQKALSTTKLWTDPRSGTEYRLQGYEPLVAQSIAEATDWQIFQCRESIKWTGRDGAGHRYHPDFELHTWVKGVHGVPKYMRVAAEVKSAYTMRNCQDKFNGVWKTLVEERGMRYSGFMLFLVDNAKDFSVRLFTHPDEWNRYYKSL